MRFFRRSLAGLFLISLTLGLIALAVNSVYTALQDRWAQEGQPTFARERVFSAEVTTVEFQTATPILTTFGEVRSRRTLELRAPAAGTVMTLADGFEDGGTVEDGALLLRIDPAEARSARDVAVADLREAENSLAEAEAAVELAEDPETRTFFDPARKIGPQVVGAMLRRGVIARAMPEGDILGFAPPLCLSREEADRVASVTAEAVTEVLG